MNGSVDIWSKCVHGFALLVHTLRAWDKLDKKLTPMVGFSVNYNH